MQKTAAELAATLGGEVAGDPKNSLSGVASPEAAQADDVIYIESQKHAEAAQASKAGAVLVPADVGLKGKTVIRVKHPKLAFVRAAEILAPEPPLVTGVHSTAVVHPTAVVGENAAVGAHAVIEERARIGDNCQIGAGCVIGEDAVVGDDCVLFPRVVLYRGARLGNRIRVHAGAVIGSDGFGYVPSQEGWVKFPQRGQVVVEDDVEIGANCTLDRGALGETRIGRGTKLDNLVHVAHNVAIGSDCVIAAQTGISGSVTLGSRVVVGGQVGMGDHCRIGDGAVLGAQAGIPSHKAIPPGQTVWGTPARPLADFKKSYPYVARLPELAARVARLEERMK